jgi:uncharacterized membrane-anchored protein YhcB (DUF1043 family)
MVIGILSAGIILGIGIGIMIKYVVDGVFSKQGGAMRQLEAENQRLTARIKELERNR